MNMDYVHAAKVVADFLMADDSAYEACPDVAFESGKSIISALQAAGFRLSHMPPDQGLVEQVADWLMTRAEFETKEQATEEATALLQRFPGLGSGVK